jgi:hypothetical protein
MNTTVSSFKEGVTMKSEEKGPTDKIGYEKPAAVDLGPTAPVVGASCVSGEGLKDGDCSQVGNLAFVACVDTGNGANGCVGGNNAEEDA